MAFRNVWLFMVFYEFLVCIFPDAFMTQQDYEIFTSRKESFLQMTSIIAVTERCVERGVIPEQAGWRVRDLVEEGSSARRAAGVFVLQFSNHLSS